MIHRAVAYAQKARGGIIMPRFLVRLCHARVALRAGHVDTFDKQDTAINKDTLGLKFSAHNMTSQVEDLVANNRVASATVEDGVDTMALDACFFRMPIAAPTTSKSSCGNAS